ncbi:MAG: bifunctional phosphopantothenoylcysteine decarboxylase/phosphopantothenate--cysteine ligase CoaBC [Clostridiales bacterium]|nr:bifunctional phosphopantothenoylcysteine decarboxylase/phosphopantothenate--cysteine ligase CoaBC [Clostridiales bacterium]
MLEGKCVVLGVTGGIAAYKACEIVSRLKKLHANVRVVLTEHACRFVQPLTFETLSGNQVAVSAFEHSFEIEHISLAKAADLLLIAPATANIIGKMAHGIADDLLSTTAMAVVCPILIAPAMNCAMYRSAALQENLETLKGRGVLTVGPESGHLACGDEDIGRMSEPETIVARVCELLRGQDDLAGKHVLVTAGPTREMVDPVRFLSNRSSGKMGYAIAEAAARRGARVTLVSGPVALERPRGVETVPITSTLDLYREVTERAKSADLVIQAAAPADFRPLEAARHKIKKTGEGMTLQLTPNPDVAAQLGRDKHEGQVLVAFAAETDDLIANARKKLDKKNADMVVANDVTQPGAGFAGDTNRVTLVTRSDARELPLMSKRDVADAILDRALELMRP